MAQDRGVDLLEIAPQASPPVCKLFEFSKYRYEREKKIKEQRKHQRAGQVKEVRLRPKISEHDLMIKLKAMENWLKKRDKVRVSVVFHGRENEHRERGLALIDRMVAHLGRIATVEINPQIAGNRLVMILAPGK